MVLEVLECQFDIITIEHDVTGFSYDQRSCRSCLLYTSDAADE